MRPGIRRPGERKVRGGRWRRKGRRAWKERWSRSKWRRARRGRVGGWKVERLVKREGEIMYKKRTRRWRRRARKGGGEIRETGRGRGGRRGDGESRMRKRVKDVAEERDRKGRTRE